MAYSFPSLFFLPLTAPVSSGAAPVDIATGYLPFSGSRFIVPNVFFSVINGTGLGQSAQYQLFTGRNGIGAIWESGASPLTLNSSSGAAVLTMGSNYYVSSPYVVLRQLTNATVTGTLGINLRTLIFP